MSEFPVQVLIIEHRHGKDVSVHSTPEEASKTLAAYVHEWWSDCQKWEDDPKENPPEDDQEAIDTYFDLVTDEFYDITETTLVVP